MEDAQNKKIVGFWGRAGSFIFNLVALIIFSQLIASLLFLKLNIEQMLFQYIFVTFAVFVIVAVTIELLLGKSIGKYIFGIETIKTDDGILTKKDIFLKAVLKILYPIEIFVLLFSKPKRTLANRITKTQTVWNDFKTKNRLIRITLGIASICIITNIALYVMSYTYCNTDIYKASTNAIESFIDNGDDATFDFIDNAAIGVIDKFDYPASSIEIKNHIGTVIRPVLTKDKGKKYLFICLVKKQTQWNVFYIITMDTSKRRGYSISYSSKK